MLCACLHGGIALDVRVCVWAGLCLGCVVALDFFTPRHCFALAADQYLQQAATEISLHTHPSSAVSLQLLRAAVLVVRMDGCGMLGVWYDCSAEFAGNVRINACVSWVPVFS
jgi:hypothetical protein